MNTTETLPGDEDDANSTRIEQISTEILNQNTSSFRLASHLLAPHQRRDATLLYAVCRLVDDIADEHRNEINAARRLARIRAELTRRTRPRPMVQHFLQMARRRELNIDCLLELISGVESDLGEVRVGSDEELLRYCYRVAGTVGLMMCPLLDVEAPAASAHAIDLGVAMQVTNICRDVLEDARRNRIYLPATRLEEVGIDPGELLAGDVDEAALAQVIDDLLEMADDYYRSAHEGMRYIPARPRLAIAVASRVYHAWGVRLKRRGSNPLAGPPQMPEWSKATAVAAGVGHWIQLGMADSPPPPHRRRLHEPLCGLPGVRS